MISSVTIQNSNLRFIRSHKSKNLIAAVGQKTVVILQLENSILICKQRYVSENVYEYYTCCDFLDYRDHIFIVVGGKPGTITVINLTLGVFYSYIDTKTEITCIKVYNNLIVSGGKDCTIQVWDFIFSKKIKQFTGHKDIVLSLDVKENTILSAGLDQSCMIWDICQEESYKPQCTIINLHRDIIIKTLFYGELVLTLSQDGKITICKPKYINNYKCYYSDDKTTTNNSDTVYNVNVNAHKTEYKFKEKRKLKHNFIFIKELCLEDTVDVNVIEHFLICLNKYNGIFTLDLLKITDKNLEVSKIDTSKQEGISFTTNGLKIFVLYEGSQIKAYNINNKDIDVLDLI